MGKKMHFLGRNFYLRFQFHVPVLWRGFKVVPRRILSQLGQLPSCAWDLLVRLLFRARNGSLALDHKCRNLPHVGAFKVHGDHDRRQLDEQPLRVHDIPHHRLRDGRKRRLSLLHNFGGRRIGVLLRVSARDPRHQPRGDRDSLLRRTPDSGQGEGDPLRQNRRFECLRKRLGTKVKISNMPMPNCDNKNILKLSVRCFDIQPSF